MARIGKNWQEKARKGEVRRGTAKNGKKRQERARKGTFVNWYDMSSVIQIQPS